MMVITIISVLLIVAGAKYRDSLSTSNKIHQITHIRKIYSTDSKNKKHHVTNNINNIRIVKQKRGLIHTECYRIYRYFKSVQFIRLSA